MLLAEYQPCVDAFIALIMSKIGDPYFDLEGYHSNWMRDYLREETGIPTLEITTSSNYLCIPCHVVCVNPSCSAFDQIFYWDVPVSMDELYRVICKCGTLPTVTGQFEDGTMAMTVGGIGSGGSGNV